ncbi:glycosyltransferase family 2 protein [Fusobacterium sp. SB021]|uniref:glycosyltransferase family 2 protein n=1 Tax=Fusobacterium sp. SB021 TaxID=2744227 RepID=UPI003CF05C7A
MKLTIIIPTLNRKKSLFQTLESYKKYKKDYDEMIIIDQSNESIENEVVREYEKVRYIHYPFPSLTKARNIGIAESKGDILVFSDDDIEILPNTLNNIKKFFSENKDVSLIGAFNEFEKEKLSKKINLKNILSCLIGKRNIFKLKKGHVVNSIFGNFPVDINFDTNNFIETEWAMGFFFACRRKLIEKWQLFFDENLISYAYAEDLDFTYRYNINSKKENMKMIFSPEICVYHHCSQEYRIPNFNKTLLYVFNRRYLSYKFNKSFFSRISIEINDFIILLVKIIKKEKPIYFIKSKILSWKYDKSLKEKIYPEKIKTILSRK